MIGISIDQYTLICIIVVVIMIFISFLYYTKRKFDSINEYNKIVSDKLETYKENVNTFNQNLKDSGIKSKERKQIIQMIKEIRGS